MNRSLVVILFSMVCFSNAAFSADEVQVCDSKTVDGYLQILKGTGAAARNPTLEELFDAFNATATRSKTKPKVLQSKLLEELRYEEERVDQPLVNVEVQGKATLYVDFQSVPEKGFGDPSCKVKLDGDGKVIPRTGYECRLEQLRSEPGADGLPKGLKTGVEIKIPVGDPKLIARVSKALGCGEPLEVSGKPVLEAVVQKAPVGGTALTVKGKAPKPATATSAAAASAPAAAASAAASAAKKPVEARKSNVIPTIQLQAVPAQPASAPAATAR